MEKQIIVWTRLNLEDISVESEDLLAFTQECHYGVSVVGSGVLSQRGLFTLEISNVKRLKQS